MRQALKVTTAQLVELDHKAPKATLGPVVQRARRVTQELWARKDLKELLGLPATWDRKVTPGLQVELDLKVRKVMTAPMGPLVEQALKDLRDFREQLGLPVPKERLGPPDPKAMMAPMGLTLQSLSELRLQYPRQ